MKNEKAFIMLLTYVIGFTTAHLVYTAQTPDYTAVANTASVVQATAQPIDAIDEVAQTEVVETESTTDKAELVLNEDGLFVKVNGELAVVSVSNSVSDYELAHNEIINMQVSNDNQYVYFCAQLAAGDKTCQSFVYEISEKLVYEVKIGNNTAITDISSLLVDWVEDNILVINSQKATFK